MAEVVKVVVDAMGGDYAPVEPVKAAVEAVKERDDIQVILTGVEDVVQAELKKYQDYPKDRIQVVNATEVIETAEPPVFAIRKKKDSSIVVGLKMVKAWRSRCDHILRKYRSRSCWRSGTCRPEQRRGASASCPADSDSQGSFPSDRLRCQCRRKTISSGTVCKDGFYLYGKRSGCQEPACRYRK